MAVLLITGNMPKIPHSILDSVATLTGTLYGNRICDTYSPKGTICCRNCFIYDDHVAQYDCKRDDKRFGRD